MTEPQLKSVPAFRSLPIFNESDPKAASITTVGGANSFRAIREYSTLPQVHDVLREGRLVPLGALRADPNGSVVVAYFGEK